LQLTLALAINPYGFIERKKMNKQTRKTRWDNSINKIREGLEELNELKSEFEDWKDNLPENLETSPLGEKLEEVVESSFCDEIESACDDAENLDLPKGFGRD